MKTLVFIESNTTGTGEHFISAAKKAGAEVKFLTNDINRYSEFYKKSGYRECDTNSFERLLCEIEKTKDVVGVYSSSEFYIHTCALIGQELRLNGPDPKAIAKCRNKLRARECFSKAEVNNPWFSKVSDPRDLDNVVSFPAVIKPVSGSGSEGVKICQTLQEAKIQAADLLKNELNSRGQKNPNYLLLEELIGGEEYSVEMFGDGKLNHPVGITKKYLHKISGVLETGHDFPVEDASIIDLLTEETHKALNAVNLKWGPSHTEIKIWNHKPFIIEINPRLAGGMIPRLIANALNIDLIRNTIDLLMNNNFQISSRTHPANFCSIRFLIPDVDNPIKSVTLPQTKQNIEVKLYEKRLRSFSKKHNDFTDRIGHILTTAGSQVEAACMAETALKQTKINYA